MRVSLPLILAPLTAFALPSVSPTTRHVHEYRSSPPPSWSALTSPLPSTPIPLRIALTQSNLHAAHDELMRVSDPTSADFAKHWTAKEVAEFFAPSKETVDAVVAWLGEEGIPKSRVKQTQSLGWLEVVNTTVSETEKLLGATYSIYKHDATGHSQLACREYSLPEAISQYIDFITPTVHFDAKVKHGPYDRDAAPGTAKGVGKPGFGPGPKPSTKLSLQDIFNELEYCSEQILPICLQVLYKMPINQVQYSPNNSFGIVEYTPQSYLATDLDLFFEQFLPDAVGRRPILDSIDGGVIYTKPYAAPNDESDLDFEYAISLVYPLNPVLYQVGDPNEGASFNNFLDAIDASYCTYEGGDNPFYDATYPDPYGVGYTGPENCGGFSAAKVISTSYAYNEADLSPSYETRQCNEYMKLGLLGTTSLFSSGDYGVASNFGLCLDPDGYYDSPGSVFVPSFPGTCPYVTSVGATQIQPGASVYEPEVACETVIFSGGGFSNVFPLPSYQEKAMRRYYEDYAPRYTAAQYNNSQVVRGIPDISANGANYIVAVDGEFYYLYGTSASAPVVGSVIALVNDLRLATGKNAVGFINPVLYANPWLMNDITSGNNPGCGTNGFSAVPGWDPVTGLGTPDYTRLVAYYLNLP